MRTLITLRCVTGPAGCADADLVAVPAHATAAGGELFDDPATPLADIPGGEPARRPAGFGARVGEIRIVRAGASGPVVVAVGLGPAGACDVNTLRTAAMALGAWAAGHRSVVTTLPLAVTDRAAASGAVAEGFQLGAYRYDARAAVTAPGGDPAPVPGGGDGASGAVSLTVCVGAGGDLAVAQRALAVAARAGEAVRWVRQMVDTPPSHLPPAVFAEHIRSLAAASGVRCEVWTADRARAAGFGGTVGVGGGSANPPVVVHLSYPGGRSGDAHGRGDAGGDAGGGTGDASPAVLGLAGKGITFDAGGINLKRDPDEISWMKSDMAGAAAVAAAVCAAADLGGDRSVMAVLPLAENLPGRGAMLPGDVVTHPDGSRTEVLDTDNEGRLVLADAVSYLAARGVGAIVDVGTLTDGGAMGHLLWGCWGSSRPLLRDLVAAGERTGDPGWHLPLRREYRELFDSAVADRTNRARDVPDTGTMAATFLSDFAGGTPWAHVDNGSTAYLDADLPPWPAGPTGSPTRALLDLLLSADSTEYTEC